MAKSKTKNQPFNLLYQFDAQKTQVDKIYDWIVGPVRIIIIVILFLVNIAFILRFPLDMKERDQKKKAEQNVRALDFYASESEKGYRELELRLASAKSYLNIYPENLSLTGQMTGQIKVSSLLEEIKKINVNFEKDIVITNYFYNADPARGASLTLTGNFSTYDKVDEFSKKIFTLEKYVSNVAISKAASSKNETPKFIIDITIKKPIVTQ